MESTQSWTSALRAPNIYHFIARERDRLRDGETYTGWEGEMIQVRGLQEEERGTHEKFDNDA